MLVGASGLKHESLCCSPNRAPIIPNMLQVAAGHKHEDQESAREPIVHPLGAKSVLTSVGGALDTT